MASVDLKGAFYSIPLCGNRQKKIACMSNDCEPRIFTKISKVTFSCSQKNRFFVCRIC